ncbi:MAG: hypothetical protein A2600_06070 [Candidatus Lambdaproteobacteria bacterium RIFOXYD1_FULL_56_27]|uniref:Antitoxin n=1 Tax=Candidatus Lambdaproteobacteria bacterium RIFOXYD2_FULL_56_26 TaxID=1817773 RepID=A0A1F6GLL2_9PROT|nr:MAG: hypothetical protein A2557_13130 [Candidatus Lambdaproteobacteria bacterium RIFOXYD2_FULL_56_26]OGH05456.1 MAG: hypothetical protein A2426_03640 [Candidatus Lambdaproteobacteria bacterium RIFOXYC1_FULL_56_13]OGH09747.1 MAG: hypothetical protein A2600_06070 [Candidatus Lambdaproteobacteria bacterium RIFOXYD1_FULL_56_27]
MIELHADFIVDEAGQKKAILLPVKEWEQVLIDLEELDDIRTFDAAKSKPQEFIPLKAALDSLSR